MADEATSSEEGDFGLKNDSSTLEADQNAHDKGSGSGEESRRGVPRLREILRRQRRDSDVSSLEKCVLQSGPLEVCFDLRKLESVEVYFHISKYTSIQK